MFPTERRIALRSQRKPNSSSRTPTTNCKARIGTTPINGPEDGDNERERYERGRRAGQSGTPAAGEADGKHDGQRLDRLNERRGE
jgi:hypothetical protein